MMGKPLGQLKVDDTEYAVQVADCSVFVGRLDVDIATTGGDLAHPLNLIDFRHKALVTMRNPFRCLAVTILAACCVNSAHAQQTREIIRGLDSKAIVDHMIDGGPNLLLDGVPEKYHFLYNRNFDKKEDEIRGDLPFTEIELSKTMCLGSCPAYRANLNLDGKATYYGQQRAPRDGYHIGEINPRAFAKLCWAIERLNLTEDKRVPDAIIHDSSETVLRISVKGASKKIEVSDYGHASTIELLLFSSLAEDIIERVDWKPAPEGGGEQGGQPERR